jgi:hypothetical protein
MFFYVENSCLYILGVYCCSFVKYLFCLGESSAFLDVEQVNDLRFDPAMFKTGDADGLLFKDVDSDFATDALDHALEHVSFFCFCCCARGNEVSTS